MGKKAYFEEVWEFARFYGCFEAHFAVGDIVRAYEVLKRLPRVLVVEQELIHCSNWELFLEFPFHIDEYPKKIQLIIFFIN